MKNIICFSGYIGINISMNIIGYLAEERSYFPLKTFFDNVQPFYNNLRAFSSSLRLLKVCVIPISHWGTEIEGRE